MIPTRPSFRVFGLHQPLFFWPGYADLDRHQLTSRRPLPADCYDRNGSQTDSMGLIRLARGVLSLLYTEFVISCLPRLVPNSVPSLPIPKKPFAHRRFRKKDGDQTLNQDAFPGEIVKAQVSLNLGSTQNNPRTASVSLPETRRHFFVTSMHTSIHEFRVTRCP